MRGKAVFGIKQARPRVFAQLGDGLCRGQPIPRKRPRRHGRPRTWSEDCPGYPRGHAAKTASEL